MDAMGGADMSGRVAFEEVYGAAGSVVSVGA